MSMSLMMSKKNIKNKKKKKKKKDKDKMIFINFLLKKISYPSTHL
jgi:hypothetical protein